MPRRILSSIVLLLLITNIMTLIFWNNSNSDSNPEKVTIKREDSSEEIETDKQVASVGNEGITYDDWIDELQDSHGKKHLKNMINKHVVEQLADEEGITISEKVIDREIAQLKMTEGVISEEKMETKEEEWREDIEHRYKLEALLTADETIPEEEIEEFYDGYKKQYDFQAASQLSHIVVNDKETAEKVETELEDGASFDLLAKEYSVDEDTRDEGGYLGFLVNTSQFFPDGYVEETEDMEEHSYSDPIKTDKGYAIIYLHSKLPEISFTYEEVKPYIRQELALDKLNQSLDAEELWEEMDIDWIYGS